MTLPAAAELLWLLPLPMCPPPLPTVDAPSSGASAWAQSSSSPTKIVNTTRRRRCGAILLPPARTCPQLSCAPLLMLAHAAEMLLGVKYAPETGAAMRRFAPVQYIKPVLQAQDLPAHARRPPSPTGAGKGALWPCVALESARQCLCHSWLMPPPPPDAVIPATSTAPGSLLLLKHAGTPCTNTLHWAHQSTASNFWHALRCRSAGGSWLAIAEGWHQDRHRVGSVGMTGSNGYVRD